MSNTRPNTSRRQVEAAADDLDFDALAIETAELAETEAPVVEDEVAGVADLLAEIDAELSAHRRTRSAVGIAWMRPGDLAELRFVSDEIVPLRQACTAGTHVTWTSEEVA